MAKSRTMWTEEKIESELKLIMKEHGCFPLQSLLKKINKDDLRHAITRKGGFIHWRAKMGVDVIRNGIYEEKEVEDWLNDKISELGYFPTYPELESIDARYLKAIGNRGGLAKFAKLLIENGKNIDACNEYLNPSPKPAKVKVKLPNKNAKTTEEFIEEAKNKWGDRYDYTNTKYVSKYVPLKYTCQKHGEVMQKGFLHIRSGCPFCSGRGIGKHTTETFIAKSNIVHNNAYDYSKTVFTGSHKDVIITCRVHGDFLQRACRHSNLGNGCPQCNGGVAYDNRDFIKKVMEKHGDKFDYSLTKYTKAHEKIVLICKKHNKQFTTEAYYVMQQEYCCPSCYAEITTSKAEREIVASIKEHYDGEIATNSRDMLEGFKEIDIFIPEFKLGIEFNGNYWHTESRVDKHFHYNKTKQANKNGINLIHLFEHQWENKKEIVKSKIKSYLNISNKIDAIETEVVKISTEDKNSFLESNHIKGKCNSSICLGLAHKGELVACMALSKSKNKKYDYELVRYCSKLNTEIVGGTSKILNSFLSNNNGTVIAYSDRCWTDDNLYKQMGFKFLKYITPNYFYYNTKNKKILRRKNCKKQILKAKSIPHYDDNLPEESIMKLNHYERIWNSGYSVWTID